MVISGMNRFFAKHGKVAFLFILIVVVFTFVLYMSGVSLPDLFFDRQMGPERFNILGREVSREEIDAEAKRIMLISALHNPEIDLDRIDTGRLYTSIQNNLVKLYAAEDAGVAITDTKVAEFIKDVPVFQQDGKFTVAKYNKFISDKLKEVNFTKKNLDQAVRDHLTIQQFEQDLRNSIIIPEDEIVQGFYNVEEKAEIQIKYFHASSFRSSVKPTGEEIKAYYDNNSGKYQSPPAKKAALVMFGYGKYRKKAWGMISEKEILEYYEQNKFRYRIPDKAVADGKAAETAGNKPEYKALPEVKDSIQTKLADQKAKELAFTDAVGFSKKLYDITQDIIYNSKEPQSIIPEAMKALKKMADSNKKKVIETDWVNAKTRMIKGVGKAPELAQTINSLYADNPLSEPVKCSKAVFVALYNDSRGSFPKAFKEVEKQVADDLIEEKSLTLAREKARNDAVDIAEKMGETGNFAEACKKLNIEFTAPQEISAARPMSAPNGQVIHSAAFATAAGSISAVKNTQHGALIVYVSKRTVPNKEAMEKNSFFAMRYKMQKQFSCTSDYLSYLVSIAESEEAGKGAGASGN